MTLLDDQAAGRASGAALGPALWLVAVWILANAAAFRLGWSLGGNDAGAEGLERAARNAFYGGFIGACQLAVLALVPTLRRPRLLLWPVVTSAGFTAAVLVAKVLDERVPSHLFETGLLYGLVIGPGVVGAQWALMRSAIAVRGPRVARLWWASHLAGWLAVEVASAALGFYSLRIALIGAGLALATAGSLIALAARPSPAVLRPL